MHFLLDLMLICVLLTNLGILGSARLSICIRLMAIQGGILGALPFFVTEWANWGPLGLRVIGLVVVTFVIKAIVIPRLLSWSVRAADVPHEVEPMVGYGISLMLGVTAISGSFWMSRQLRLPHEATTDLVLPTALATILIGLLFISTRKKAVMQALGYLVLENGIYILGVALASEQPFLVEMGVLLDVFVGVFVMGITIFHISREFDHIDVDQLSELKG